MNPATVEVHELLDERQPDARAFVATRAGALDPVKPFEQAREIVLGDARAGVRDLEARGRAVYAPRYEATRRASASRRDGGIAIGLRLRRSTNTCTTWPCAAA
jgi:hypothetical protein